MTEYIYLLDILDSLGYSDVSNEIEHLPPTEWLQNESLLQIVIHFINSLSSTTIHQRPQHSAQLPSINTPHAQIHQQICDFISQHQAFPYIDLISSSGSIFPSDLISNTDCTGLVLDFILSEYQFSHLASISISTPEASHSASSNTIVASSQPSIITPLASRALTPQDDVSTIHSCLQQDLSAFIRSPSPHLSLAQTLSSTLLHVTSHFITLIISLARLQSVLQVSAPNLDALFSPLFIALATRTLPTDTSIQMLLSTPLHEMTSFHEIDTILSHFSHTDQLPCVASMTKISMDLIQNHFILIWSQFTNTIQSLLSYVTLHQSTTLTPTIAITMSSHDSQISNSDQQQEEQQQQQLKTQHLPLFPSLLCSPSDVVIDSNPSTSLSQLRSICTSPILPLDAQQSLVAMLTQDNSTISLSGRNNTQYAKQMSSAIQLLFQRLHNDYSARHRMLLLRIIVTTQTFLFSLLHGYNLSQASDSGTILNSDGVVVTSTDNMFVQTNEEDGKKGSKSLTPTTQQRSPLQQKRYDVYYSSVSYVMQEFSNVYLQVAPFITVFLPQLFITAGTSTQLLQQRNYLAFQTCCHRLVDFKHQPLKNKKADNDQFHPKKRQIGSMPDRNGRIHGAIDSQQ